MISGLYCLWHCRWCLVMDHFKITGYLINILINTLSFIAAFCSAPVPKNDMSFYLWLDKVCPQGQLETICFVNYSFPIKRQWYHNTLMLLLTENDCSVLKVAAMVLILSFKLGGVLKLRKWSTCPNSADFWLEKPMVDPMIFIMDAGLWRDAQEELAMEKGLHISIS